MRADNKNLAAHAVQTGCAVVAALAVIALIDAAPGSWFAVFDRMGPDFKPWLIGGAAVISGLASLGFGLLVRKGFRLPKPQD